MRKWALTLLGPIVCAVVSSSCDRGVPGGAGRATEVVNAGIVELEAPDGTRSLQSAEAGASESGAGQSAVASALTLAREGKIQAARDLIQAEIKGGRGGDDLTAVSLVVDVLEKGDRPALERARDFLAKSQGRSTAGMLRLLVASRWLEAGDPVEAARSLGDENWWTATEAGLEVADRIAEAATQEASPEKGSLALSVLLDRYTHGPLDFDAHERRLRRYYQGLQSHLNQLIFNPAGNWHSREYVAQKGDSLDRICKRFAASNAGALRLEHGILVMVNRLPGPDRIREGQRLRIPVDPLRTVVEKRAFVMKVFLGDLLVRLYRVGLGKNSRTPVTTFEIAAKQKHPGWYHPDGRFLPYQHPENVLGDYFVKFRHETLQSFGVHGTTDLGSIGKEESMGCIRMLPLDLEEFVSLVPLGSMVTVLR